MLYSTWVHVLHTIITDYKRLELACLGDCKHAALYFMLTLWAVVNAFKAAMVGCCVDRFCTYQNTCSQATISLQRVVRQLFRSNVCVVRSRLVAPIVMHRSGVYATHTAVSALTSRW
jgi:hypothetical protein